MKEIRLAATMQIFRLLNYIHRQHFHLSLESIHPLSPIGAGKISIITVQLV
jgi:hypothetical protein